MGVYSTVLTAHLDSRPYGTGPFARVTSLRPGDSMAVLDGAGVRYRFVVSQMQVFRKEVLPYERLFDQAGPARIVPVTCGGRYRPEAGGWDSNVVVTFVAEP